MADKKSSVPTLVEAVKTFFDSRLSEVLHTCLPGKIEKYDSKTRKATVSPMIKKKYLDGQILALKPIENVPVMFYGAGKAILRLPESQVIGQKCLLVFCERALEFWLSSGKVSEPGSTRKFDLSDAIAILSLHSFSKDDKDTGGDDLTLQYNDSLIRIKKNGNIEMGVNTFKRLINENFQSIFNDHVHNFTAAPSGTFATSKPASLIPTIFPTPGTGNPLALFGSQIADSDMTSKTKAE